MMLRYHTNLDSLNSLDYEISLKIIIPKYVLTNIHDLTPFSIAYWTPASRLHGLNLRLNNYVI